jgi:uncharacterized repeat protein (TIGR03803 family)
MSMRSWIRNLFSRPATCTIRKAPHRSRLAVEALEDRTVPSTLTALASFDGANGSNPGWGLIRDSQGNFYGSTCYGGASNLGTIFEMAAGTNTITTLASFDGTNGALPTQDLLMDSQGNLFGTTQNAGAFNHGTVFELAAGSHTITTLGSFDVFTNGQLPDSGLVMDSSGNLFGTTPFGSSSGVYAPGTVFEVAAGSNTITTLATFNGFNGANPVGTMVMDSHGNLFGTALSGGASNLGTVFELAAGSHTITTVAAFDGTNGAYPQVQRLLLDSQGNLFGTTSDQGPFGGGTVFEVAAGSNTITTVAAFDGTNGSDPWGGVVMDSHGNLFGTAQLGGASNVGTVFEVAAGSNTITALASFDGTNGAQPLGSVVLDSSGNLYGTAYGGGASGNGTIYEVTESPDPAAPFLVVPGPQSAYEDVAQPISGISVGGGTSGTLTVTLGVGQGTLTLGTTTGLSVAGNGTGSVTLSGAVSDLNAALAGLLYQGGHNYGGIDTLSITVGDGTLSTGGSVAIAVESAAQQAADLQALVNGLRGDGDLNQGQSNALSAKLNLQGNSGDAGKVQAFLNQVAAFRSSGALTPDQAADLLYWGDILLLSVTR